MKNLDVVLTMSFHLKMAIDEDAGETPWDLQEQLENAFSGAHADFNFDHRSNFTEYANDLIDRVKRVSAVVIEHEESSELERSPAFADSLFDHAVILFKGGFTDKEIESKFIREGWQGTPGALRNIVSLAKYAYIYLKDQGRIIDP